MTRPLKDVENTKGILRQLDRDRDGRLSVSEFKDALFKEMGVKNLAEEHVDALLQLLLDPDGDELIEIREFLAVVQNAGRIDFSDEAAGGLNTEQADQFKRAQRCLAEIRTAMTTDLFEYFTFFGEKRLPTFFEPSFLQPLLEQESKYRPSRRLNMDPSDAKLLDTRGFANVE